MAMWRRVGTRSLASILLREKNRAFMLPIGVAGQSSHGRGAVYARDMPLNRGSLGAHRDLVNCE